MVETLEEQIADRCIHFNGIQNYSCEKDVVYENVRIDSRPYKYPCFKTGSMSGGECLSCEFPTEEFVKKEVDEIHSSGKRMMNAYSAVIKYIEGTGKLIGAIECPQCKAILLYTKAESNGHIHAKCSGCDINWME